MDRKILWVISIIAFSFIIAPQIAIAGFLSFETVDYLLLICTGLGFLAVRYYLVRLERKDRGEL